MSGRQALLLAAAILLLLVAVIAGWWLGRERRRPAEEEIVTTTQQETREGPGILSELYFPGPGGRLFSEERELPVAEDRLVQIELLLSALLAGPESEDLYPALPAEISIAWIHLSPDAVLYLDLKYSGEEEFPAWGSRQELLAVYSVVNTVLANAPDIESVVLLRNGQQRPTFAGHLDTTRPLLSDRRLVATR